MKIVIPMALPSVANLREHWATRARRTKAQRAAVVLSMCVASRGLARLVVGVEYGARYVVTLTRVAARPLDDDNLASAFKAVRDQIAASLGTTDAPRGPLVWRYEQKRCGAKSPPWVLISIEPQGGQEVTT